MQRRSPFTVRGTVDPEDGYRRYVGYSGISPSALILRNISVVDQGACISGAFSELEGSMFSQQGCHRIIALATLANVLTFYVSRQSNQPSRLLPL
jgi:hypothetical protein